MVLLAGAACAQDEWRANKGEVCFVRPESDAKVDASESWVRVASYKLPLTGGQSVCIYLDPGTVKLKITSPDPDTAPQNVDSKDACASPDVVLTVTQKQRQLFFISPAIKDAAPVCGWQVQSKQQAAAKPADSSHHPVIHWGTAREPGM